MATEDRSTPILIVIAVALLAAIIGGLALLRRDVSRSAATTPPPMRGDEKAYLTQISTADPRMSAAENFLGGTVTYLNAQVTNNGTRPVRRLTLKLEFHDTLEQVVLRETAHPITPRTPPLKPGETRAFQVAFEHMPMEWNQGPPVITPEYVGF
ncbi:MAG: FxLYD domain-containing protein [Terriglobia bacterium]